MDSFVGGVPTARLEQCQMAHGTPRLITLKNLISPRNPHLPSFSCADRLNWQMTELQATDKERLRKSTISTPIWMTNAAWRLSRMSSPSGAGAYYLPSYSPDLNPIEMAFSKLKALLRKAAERTIPGLIRLIGRLLKKFSPEECRNFLSHAGYAC